MEKFQEEFIEFMVESKALDFGDFTLKSGRKAPYFINTGKYKTGDQIYRLGMFYAKAIQFFFCNQAFSVLFGPAYKGIPLVVTTAIALAGKYRKSINFCFNRKEAKDHGEGGNLIGHELRYGDRVLIIEDVTTSGASIRETVPILKKTANIELVGLIVSVDRMEKGLGEIRAMTELSREFEMPTYAIVTISDIVEYLHNREINGRVLIDDKMKKRIDDYRTEYGAK